jgi:phosphoglycerol transferase MdoB-like AlkP superfamily enzyme
VLILYAFGNDKNITPFLDDLAKESLLFTNCYASGNRTVRGLEAVTLCLPPTAGKCCKERTIKTNSQQEASLQKGYSVDYLYGDFLLITWKIFSLVTDTRLSIKKAATF